MSLNSDQLEILLSVYMFESTIGREHCCQKWRMQLNHKFSNETRWNGRPKLVNVRTFLKNRYAMIIITLQNEDDIVQGIRSLIQNVGLANETRHQTNFRSFKQTAV